MPDGLRVLLTTQVNQTREHMSFGVIGISDQTLQDFPASPHPHLVGSNRNSSHTPSCNGTPRSFGLSSVAERLDHTLRSGTARP